jgi:starvation-inducible outer membrane lipoprotein
MKKLLILFPLAFLVACSSAPPQTKVQANLDVKEMDRTDVIKAARECINARMKPVVQSVPQRTDHGSILIPIAVNCEIYSPTLQ